VTSQNSIIERKSQKDFLELIVMRFSDGNDDDDDDDDDDNDTNVSSDHDEIDRKDSDAKRQRKKRLDLESVKSRRITSEFLKVQKAKKRQSAAQSEKTRKKHTGEKWYEQRNRKYPHFPHEIILGRSISSGHRCTPTEIRDSNLFYGKLLAEKKVLWKEKKVLKKIPKHKRSRAEKQRLVELADEQSDMTSNEYSDSDNDNGNKKREDDNATGKKKNTKKTKKKKVIGFNDEIALCVLIKQTPEWLAEKWKQLRPTRLKSIPLQVPLLKHRILDGTHDICSKLRIPTQVLNDILLPFMYLDEICRLASVCVYHQGIARPRFQHHMVETLKRIPHFCIGRTTSNLDGPSVNAPFVPKFSPGTDRNQEFNGVSHICSIHTRCSEHERNEDLLLLVKRSTPYHVVYDNSMSTNTTNTSNTNEEGMIIGNNSNNITSTSSTIMTQASKVFDEKGFVIRELPQKCYTITNPTSYVYRTKLTKKTTSTSQFLQILSIVRIIMQAALTRIEQRYIGRGKRVNKKKTNKTSTEGKKVKGVHIDDNDDDNDDDTRNSTRKKKKNSTKKKALTKKKTWVRGKSKIPLPATLMAEFQGFETWLTYNKLIDNVFACSSPCFLGPYIDNLS
jgi:hypothetical protein